MPLLSLAQLSAKVYFISKLKYYLQK